MLSFLCSIALLFLLAPGRSYAALRSYNFTVHNGTRAPDGFPREVYLINGQQPGPLIEIDEGDVLEVFVRNELAVETTLHWHGILQRGTPQMDGVPGVTQFPIPPGGNLTYRFSLENQYGFYWYHSHFRAYYDDAIRGSLVVHPASSRRRPFEELTGDKNELNALLQAERDATPVLLTDWHHKLSDAVYAQYFETGAFPNCVDSLLANGHGRVQCLPDYILQAGTALGMEPESLTDAPAAVSTSMGSMAMGSMAMGSMVMGSTTQYSMTMDHTSTTPMPAASTSMNMRRKVMATSSAGSANMSDLQMTALGPRGCTSPMMFKPGYNMSSLPPETCINTTLPLLTIPANHSQGWLALHLVNAGEVSKLSVSLDAHSLFVYAADGLFVKLQEVKVLSISIGQRYSVMIKLNQPPGQYFLRFASSPVGDMQQVIEDQAIISYHVGDAIKSDIATMYNIPDSVWMLLNGSAKANIPELNAQQLAPFEPQMPPSGAADVTRFFTINQTDVVTWVLDGYPYSEPKTPIIHGNTSDGWAANTTLHMPYNSTIDIVMRIANDSMDTMGHPMHLHGHKFWVLGTGSGPFPYNSVTDAPQTVIDIHSPPYRDTVELPASGWAAIRYVTDNPGAWLFHCHIQWHLVSGMALVLVEGEDRLSSLVGASVNTTTPQELRASSTATSSGPASTAAKHRTVAIAAVLSAMFISY